MAVAQLVPRQLQPSRGLALQLTQPGEQELIRQVPLTQEELAKKLQHLVPQAPQLLKSVCRSTQPPEHAVVPAGQAQVPLLQTWPAPQVWPQAPQLWTSLCRLAHPPVQAVVPAGQAQVPLLQTWPVPHAWPQAPQLLTSLWRSTQAPEQSV